MARRPTTQKVLFAVSEMFPIVKTGGLADVAGALPGALAELGVEVRTLLPAYPGVRDAVGGLGEWRSVGDPLGAGEARIALGRIVETDAPVWLLDSPNLFDRPGGPYLDPNGADWPDNHLRFAQLARVAALICDAGDLLGWRPDVLHAHDWQAGLAPAFLAFRGGRRPASVFSIHNPAFQGNFPAEVTAAVGLPPQAFAIDGVEFHGKVSFLKAGIRFADRITTVSPTYAREILTPQGGFGFDGMLRARAADLSGILNGIDTGIWDPSTDRRIPVPYDSRTLDAKAENAKALRTRFHLPETEGAPLIGVVSRFAEQKGIDLILAALPEILAAGAQLVVLGSGDAALEKAFVTAARDHPQAVGVEVKYDEGLAHLVQAGADMLLVPSRFEPCGLTQICALRYGTVPVVRRTGGLADTVVDADSPGGGTGFLFDDETAGELARAVERAVALFRTRAKWRAMQRRAMKQDFSWKRAAGEYAELYGSLTR